MERILAYQLSILKVKCPRKTVIITCQYGQLPHIVPSLPYIVALSLFYLLLSSFLDLPENQRDIKSTKAMYIELYNCIPLFTSNIMLQQEWPRCL